MRYALIEFITGALFVAAWLTHPPAVAICGCVFLAVLIAASFIDLEEMIIPDELTIYPAILAVLASCLVPSLHGEHGPIRAVNAILAGGEALAGAAVGTGILMWIAFLADAMLQKEAMGMGDVKLMGVIGAVCGWRGAVFAIFGGAILGLVALVPVIAWQRIRQTQALATPASSPQAEQARSGGPDGDQLGFGVEVPFGPMLAIGAAAYFLGANHWFDPRWTVFLPLRY